VAVADGGERLHAEEKAIEKPMRRPPRDAVLLKTVKDCEENIESDVQSADERGELRPAQAQQPAINVAPFPRIGVDLDELDLAGSNRNFIASASPMANFLVHEPIYQMWPFKKTKLAGPDEFPAVVDAIGGKLRSRGFAGEADRLRYLVHEGVWTTSNEFYDELRRTLNKIRQERRELPPDIAAEIRRLIKSIDRICRWR
jgi:hypothetical protein